MNNEEKQIKDLIDRYVWQVTKRQPLSQQADIEKELRGLIDDMLTAKSEKPTKEDLISVLRELGHPSGLAAKYSNTKNWLIGPEYFDIYLTLLKIVLAVSAFGVILAEVIGYITEPPQNILSAIGLLFVSVLSAAMQAFAWVTGIFAIVEHYAKNAPDKKDWNPADLPQVPEAKNRIKPSEPIFGIVFTVIFLVVINTMPHLLGAYIYNDSAYVIVPLFNLTTFYKLLPLIDIMICIGIVKELLKLIIGRYTVSLALVLISLNLISLVMFIWLFGPSSEIWNPNFLSGLGTEWSNSAEAAYSWNLIPRILAGLSIFGNVVDCIQLIVRAFRQSGKSTD